MKITFSEENMKAFKGKIEITNGIISEIEEKEDGLVLIIDGVRHDFDNSVAYPGFVDSHCHVTGIGMRLSMVNLSDCRSEEECIEKLKNSNYLRDGWIEGWGWNQENWTKKEFPDKKLLDKAFPDNPVCLTRIDGHSQWVNSRALQIAEIKSNLLDPPGGQILRGEDGEPNGMLIDNAINYVLEVIPPYSPEQIAGFISKSLNNLAANGITEVHDMDVEIMYIDVFKEMMIQKMLPIRVASYIKAQNNEWMRDSIKGFISDFLSVRGLKFYIDGALGSKGASLIGTYMNDDKSGLNLIEEKSLFNRTKMGLINGFDIAVHAIGDKACQTALNVFSNLRKDPLLKGKGRLRLEHSQMIDKNDIQKFESNNIAASVQPIHYSSDCCGMFQSRIRPEHYDSSYRWKSLIDAGALLVAGSDSPIESHNPLIGLWSFVNRKPFVGDFCLNAAEALSPEQALDAYCVNPHIALGNEQKRGAIKEWMQADITIVNIDLTQMKDADWNSFNIVATICNGNIIYQS